MSDSINTRAFTWFNELFSIQNQDPDTVAVWLDSGVLEDGRLALLGATTSIVPLAVLAGPSLRSSVAVLPALLASSAVVEPAAPSSPTRVG